MQNDWEKPLTIDQKNDNLVVWYYLIKGEVIWNYIQ